MQGLWKPGTLSGGRGGGRGGGQVTVAREGQGVGKGDRGEGTSGAGEVEPVGVAMQAVDAADVDMLDEAVQKLGELGGVMA